MNQPPLASLSLYAGNLHPEVTERNLWEIFNEIGPVHTIRVCRDRQTHTSLGYAYVNFRQVGDAERALDALNYTNVKGREMRLMWVQRDPSLRKKGVGNIFIKNLDPEIDNKTLHDTFSELGNILSVKVVTNPDGTSKGYGYVHFADPEAAQKAIGKVNNMLLKNKQLSVAQHIPIGHRKNYVDRVQAIFTNIYIRNLPDDFTKEDLRKLFSEFGTPTSWDIKPSPLNTRKKFGMVNMSSHEEAVLAVTKLQERQIAEEKLYVDRFKNKPERQLEARNHQREAGATAAQNLYIKNLDDTIDEAKLLQKFSAFGTVKSHAIAREEKTGISLGYGFVCFSNAEEAAKAMETMNGQTFGRKPIYVNIAQRKEERMAMLASRMNHVPYPQEMYYRFYPPYDKQERYYPPYNTKCQLCQQFVPHPLPVRPPPRWSSQPRPSTNYAPAYDGFRRPQGPRTTARPPQPQQPQPQQYLRNTKPPPRRHVSMNPSGSLDAGVIAQMPPDQQKSFLGEKLFLIVEKKEPDLAGKITGMLLEGMDVAELINLLEMPASLESKILEAMAVLRDYNQNTPREQA